VGRSRHEHARAGVLLFVGALLGNLPGFLLNLRVHGQLGSVVASTFIGQVLYGVDEQDFLNTYAAHPLDVLLREEPLAILRLIELQKSVVEGAAATTLAACMSGKLKELRGKRVVLLLCGGNIDPNVLSRVIERGLVADGRLSRFTAIISDRPGGLADLTAQIAAVGASIKEVVHDRAFASSDLSAVNVLCTVETRDRAHLEKVLSRLHDHGVKTSATR